ncbi:hypothetical protein COB11_04765 [Candidatus Aerophobetes bacterium]|uniref:Integrase catalytic domain-containing protein n=1 Tax=Aerophobetes bacterium TaxID=2030807 RepID=A0A2A4YG07_UNCAE|nr:MAG: hypothetical protein COB11_04765 [Candidatus Aerophobetes bacterium]
MLAKVIIQTDNGSEFGGDKRRKVDYGITSTTQEKYKAEHRYIPPECCNANANVESVHATIEQEFFDLETFNEHQDFMLKTQAYQYFYSMVRSNFSKKGKTSSQILFEDRKEIDPEFLFCPVIDLDAKFREKFGLEKTSKGGQHVPKCPRRTEIPPFSTRLKVSFP